MCGAARPSHKDYQVVGRLLAHGVLCEVGPSKLKEFHLVLTDGGTSRLMVKALGFLAEELAEQIWTFNEPVAVTSLQIGNYRGRMEGLLQKTPGSVNWRSRALR